MSGSSQTEYPDASAPPHVQFMAGFMVLALQDRLGEAHVAHRAIEAAFAACLSCMDEVEAQKIAAAYARMLENDAGSQIADLALNELETRISRTGRSVEPPLPCGLPTTMLCTLGSGSFCPAK